MTIRPVIGFLIISLSYVACTKKSAEGPVSFNGVIDKSGFKEWRYIAREIYETNVWMDQDYTPVTPNIETSPTVLFKFPATWKVNEWGVSSVNGTTKGAIAGIIKLKPGQACFDNHYSGITSYGSGDDYAEINSTEKINWSGGNGRRMTINHQSVGPKGPIGSVTRVHEYCFSDHTFAFVQTFYGTSDDEAGKDLLISGVRFVYEKGN